MANKIQLRRDTTANWTRVNPILDDGEPGLEIDTNKVKYGDGNTAWNALDYASGGLTDVDGVVTFPGDMLVGTLWPDDPLPGGDKESVVWAKDDTEYLGLWWGGDQTYPESGYGPVTGIMIGSNDSGSLTDDFSDNASPEGTRVVVGVNDDTGYTNEWTFDRDGSLTTPGEVIIESNNAHGGAGYAGLLTLTNSTGGSTNPNKYIRLNSTGTLEVIDSAYANTIMSLSDGGNLTVKGSINSNAGTGNVTLQASDGSNPRNFVFNTDGSITLPHLASGSQGVGAFDARNNLIALTSGDTVDFANFSGMILVNTHNGGGVTLYLCGGGGGNAVAIGDSKAGNSVGAMAHNNGISGYTFTADETGDHVFCAIRTRTGA